MTNTTPELITGYEDYLDSRDMQERLDFLSGFNDEELSEKEKEEYNELYRLRQYMIDDYGEESWNWGYSFIRDDFFPDYAQEFAEEIGAIDEKQYWLTCHIDWEGVARDMRQDYWDVEIFGNTYWTREP